MVVSMYFSHVSNPKEQVVETTLGGIEKHVSIFGQKGEETEGAKRQPSLA